MLGQLGSRDDGAKCYVFPLVARDKTQNSLAGRNILGSFGSVDTLSTVRTVINSCLVSWLAETTVARNSKTRNSQVAVWQFW